MPTGTRQTFWTSPARYSGLHTSVLYTPPYHPEFNPIEKTWGKLKGILRRWPTLTRHAFDQAVTDALRLITLDDTRLWVSHAGYQAQFNLELV